MVRGVISPGRIAVVENGGIMNDHENAGGSRSQVVLFEGEDGKAAVEVRLDKDTVWMSQRQIADLFDTTPQNITMHLRNVFGEGELIENATCKESLQVQREGNRTVRRTVLEYNLDAIISVGYRIKSKTATKFRIWATERLREYLVQGVIVNEQRMQELGQIISIMGRANDDMVSGVASVLAGYMPGLTMLRDYDEGAVRSAPRTEPGWELTIEEAREVIAHVAGEFPADEMFGRERGDALESIVTAIYQTFGGEDLYPTVEEKAANLLYLVVKDHPLSDGNKRTAAALFVTFLAHNGMLSGAGSELTTSNNALAAMTLMVATSDPAEKDLMIALLVRMLSESAG